MPCFDKIQKVYAIVSRGSFLCVCWCCLQETQTKPNRPIEKELVWRERLKEKRAKAKSRVMQFHIKAHNFLHF